MPSDIDLDRCLQFFVWQPRTPATSEMRLAKCHYLQTGCKVVSNYEVFKILSLCNLCNFDRQGGFAPSVQDNNEALEYQMASKYGDLQAIYPVEEQMALLLSDILSGK